jgi:hypothetical protein
LCVFCVLGETGQIICRAKVSAIDLMIRILEALPVGFEICYEASCRYERRTDVHSVLGDPTRDEVCLSSGRAPVRRQSCEHAAGMG